MASTTPRIPPLDPQLFTDEQAELAGGRDGARAQLNIVKLLVQNPPLYRNWMQFAMYLIAASTLSPRHRELIILHTSALCGGKYDIAQHRLIAQRAGLSIADIEAATSDGSGLTEFERTLLRGTAELVRDHRISDTTYALLAREYSPQQLLDLVFTVGNYNLMCMTTSTFDVQIEPNIESGWKPY